MVSKKELNNIIDCCYGIEIDKLAEEQGKLLENTPKKPITEDLKSSMKYMLEVKEYISKSEKYSKKLDKLYKERANHYNSMIDYE